MNDTSVTVKVRSKEGRALDELYRQHKIGWAYYNKIYKKPKYWEIHIYRRYA